MYIPRLCILGIIFLVIGLIRWLLDSSFAAMRPFFLLPLIAMGHVRNADDAFRRSLEKSCAKDWGLIACVLVGLGLTLLGIADACWHIIPVISLKWG